MTFCLINMLRDKNVDVVFRAFFHLSLKYILLMQFTTDAVHTSLRVQMVSLDYPWWTWIVLKRGVLRRVLAQSIKIPRSPRKQWTTTSSCSCGTTSEWHMWPSRCLWLMCKIFGLKLLVILQMLCAYIAECHLDIVIFTRCNSAWWHLVQGKAQYWLLKVFLSNLITFVNVQTITASLGQAIM